MSKKDAFIWRIGWIQGACDPDHGCGAIISCYTERRLYFDHAGKLIKDLESFIDQSITNRNYIKEFPVKTSNSNPVETTNTFNMYNIDPILRRSKPLQQTKESKSNT